VYFGHRLISYEVGIASPHIAEDFQRAMPCTEFTCMTKSIFHPLMDNWKRRPLPVLVAHLPHCKFMLDKAKLKPV
jgi:hypothetical protein